MKLRTALLPLSLLLVGAAAFPAWAPLLKGDYTSLPPEPAQVHQRLSGLGTSLTEAAKAAEAATSGGLIQSISVSPDASQYVVDLYTRETRRSVTIDANSGSVVSNDATPRFPGRAVSGDWVETESGLKYYDLVVGSGDMPAGPSTVVTIHYTGWLVDGTKFDSSVDRGEPTSYQLNGFIAGWIEGVGSMRVGGVRKLIIPFDLAYGVAGRPPVIPPKATLVFDIELLGV